MEIAPHLKRQEKRQENCGTFEASREMSLYTKLYGVLTSIYDDDGEVYDLPVISLCSLFGFVSLHGLRIVTVKISSFAFAIIVFCAKTQFVRCFY